jgi:hypothetical protein
MQKTFTIQLETGVLHLNLEHGNIPVNRLLGFASRINKKRKFSLVSKILGKHYAVTPRLMRWSYRALARKIQPINADDKSVWIGMAEMATGLGYGIYAAACNEGLNNGLFLQTTRYTITGQERIFFIEEHSHSPDFFLYYPSEAADREHFLTATTLVLIDDEITTGRTFAHLIKSYQKINPALQQVFIVTLINFSSMADRLAIETQAKISIHWLHFRQGTIRFNNSDNTSRNQIALNVFSKNECKKHLLGWQGRLGIKKPVRLATDTVSKLQKLFISDDHDHRPLLVIGTGECNAPGFMIACALETSGYQVKLQSTTRSPLLIGNNIGSAFQFEDNYNDGIVNFIYNLTPSDYREIIISHETPLNNSLIALCQSLHAISARFFAPVHENSNAEIQFTRPVMAIAETVKVENIICSNRQIEVLIHDFNAVLECS